MRGSRYSAEGLQLRRQVSESAIRGPHHGATDAPRPPAPTARLR